MDSSWADSEEVKERTRSVLERASKKFNSTWTLSRRTLYNHLLAAQSPDGRGWIYYLGLRDSKRYRWHTDPECCPSRGVRAIAQMPTHAFGLFPDGIGINFYDAAQAELPLPSGSPAAVQVVTEYPFDGQIELTVTPVRPESFALHLRLPGWCRQFSLKVNGETEAISANQRGYLGLGREWSAGDQVELGLEMPVVPVVDSIGNLGRVALTRGPLVFAVDVADLPAGTLLNDVILALDGQNLGQSVRVLSGEAGGTIQLAARRVIPKKEIKEMERMNLNLRAWIRQPVLAQRARTPE